MIVWNISVSYLFHSRMELRPLFMFILPWSYYDRIERSRVSLVQMFSVKSLDVLNLNVLHNEVQYE